LATIFFEIAFALACAKEPGRDINWPGSLGLLYGVNANSKLTHPAMIAKVNLTHPWAP
jgi:hypothetical protein